MIKQMYALLLKHSITRRYQRRLLGSIRKLVGCPDAYDDLLNIVSLAAPAAILDIGSYIGDTVVRFVDETNIPVFAFEPTPKTFAVLANRFADSSQVQVNQLALGSHNGQEQFFLNQNPQTNSILENDSGNTQSFAQFTNHLDRAAVEVQTLDTWVESQSLYGPLVVKADIQGAEGLLLEGGKRVFKEQVLAFFSEVQLAPMYQTQTDFFCLNRTLTQDFDFYLANIYPCFRDQSGRAVQTDALWIKHGLKLKVV